MYPWKDFLNNYVVGLQPICYKWHTSNKELLSEFLIRLLCYYFYFYLHFVLLLSSSLIKDTLIAKKVVQGIKQVTCTT